MKGLAELLFNNDSGIPECHEMDGDDILMGRYDRRRSSKRQKGSHLFDSATRHRSSSTYNETGNLESKYLKSPISESRAVEDDEGQKGAGEVEEEVKIRRTIGGKSGKCEDMLCDDISEVRNTPDKRREILKYDDNLESGDKFYEDLSGINVHRETYRTNPSQTFRKDCGSDNEDNY